MMKARISNILVIILIIAGGTLISYEKNAGGFVKIKAEFSVHNFSLKAYISHPVIRINSDAEFATVATNEGWLGSGTVSDPYIIENYDIDAQGGGACIYIGNTTVYFIVRNCYLHNTTVISSPYFGGTGITLYNVQNGTIFNTYFSNNSYDIYLNLSSNNKIESNHCNSNGSVSIYLSHSNQNAIYNNTRLNRRIYLFYSDRNTLYNNTCYGEFYAIYFYYSDNNNISNNNCSYKGNWGIAGIYIYHSNNWHLYLSFK